MTRKERKQEIARVLRENCEEGGKPLSCRQIAQAMSMRGYSYINNLLGEMCDDGQIRVQVLSSNKAVSSVEFRYYV